jgi:ADP-heptose:LPS heptosyltransferase
VARAGLVLCGDTGVAHLATAYATRSVLLFGPTPPDRWGPVIDPELHTVLWHGNERRSSVGDPHAASIDPLLADISVDEVLAAARSGGAAGVEVEPRDRAGQPLLPADARSPAQ